MNSCILYGLSAAGAYKGEEAVGQGPHIKGKIMIKEGISAQM